MEAILFALSLEVALLQMKILEGSIKIRSLQWKPNDNWKKLEEERLFVKRVLESTLVEVGVICSWRSLKQAVISLAGRSATPTEQRKQHELLKKSHKNITKELKTKRQQWSELLEQADEKIAFLKDKNRDDLLNASMRLCYAEKCLSARSQSLEWKLQIPRPTLPRVDQEDRVHVELLKLLQLQIAERQNIEQYWRAKYADDICVITKLIIEKQEQWQAVFQRRESLQALYDEHAEEIRSWLNVKRERSERRAKEERQKSAATSIQSWWRGVMVRRGLGVFKFLKIVKKPSAKTKKK